MISFAALGRFAAEFLAVLAGLAGLALVGLRPELLSRSRLSRAALALGFALIATAAFLEGSLIVHDRTLPEMVAARGVGLLALLIGSRQWEGGDRSRRLLWIGIAGMAVAAGLLAGGVGALADVALGVGGAGMAIALRVASGRSIAARVAAGSAAILLLVILVLSVSLSAVLSTTVRDDAGRRLDARAATEADFAQKTEPENAVDVAANVALSFVLIPVYAEANSALVTNGNLHTGTLPANLTNLFDGIEKFIAPDLAITYINTIGHEYAKAAPGGFSAIAISDAVGSDVVKQAFAQPAGGQRAAVQVFGSAAFVVAVQAIQHPLASGTVDYPSAIVVVQPLDSSYLIADRRPLDPSVSLAIVSRTAVLAEAGNAGSRAQLLSLASRTLDSGNPIALSAAGGLLSATQPILAGSQPVAVLVASTPATVVTDVRDKLLRTLFLLAMAGTLVALALAAYSGERVSGGIRVLTEAAQRIQAGNFAEPAGVRSDDEVGVLGAAFDSMAMSISEQTAALQLAAEEETALRNQLEAVVAGMGEALIAVDADGRVTLFNRAAEELIGLDSLDVEGELVGAVLVAVGEDGAVLATRLEHPLPGRWMATATVATELGPRIPVAITAGPLRGPDGGVSGGVLVLRDLRPERQVEQLKSEFLSRIGHELRTPLTGILGYAEILLHRQVPTERAHEMHQQIVDAGRRLYRVVQMLEFSAAAQAGRSLIRSEQMNVRQLVDEAVTTWAERVGGGHSIARRIPRELPEITGDRRWLTMAIDELIDNAVKFSPEGGKVGVSAQEATWESGGVEVPAVRITVSDDGVGLTEAEQLEVFTDFVQGDGSDTRRFGGLGLGLSLVKRVAEAHGGGVQVESLPKHGSKFSMIVPTLTIKQEG